MPAATKTARAPRVAKAKASPAEPSTYRSEHQRDVVNRLKRIEGQVRGLIDMVESGRPCEDVAQQMSAARKAMEEAMRGARFEPPVAGPASA